MRERTQLQEEKGLFINNNNNKQNKTNKQKQPLEEKQTDKQARTRQGRAGQGRAGQGRAGQGTKHTSNDNEPTRNCKHKEIIKGANEEGNEGEQLGKINQ